MKSLFFLLTKVFLPSNSDLIRSIGTYRASPSIFEDPHFRVCRPRSPYYDNYCNFDLDKGINLSIKRKM